MPNIIKNAGRISPTPMGDYDTTTTYRRLDWVKYGGTSYICRKNNTVNIPPSDPERWQKIIDEVGDMNVIFTEPTERTIFSAGESLSVIIGKIKKFLTDIHKVAFTGNYSDLEDTPGIVSKNENGLVQKGDGQANKVWKTDANGNPAWRDDENTQAITSVNGKTGAVTLTATDVNACPATGVIDKLTNIGQITGIGFWAIGSIDNAYATSIGIDNNAGDFYALVLSYNGNGIDFFNFGTIILTTPRINGFHYEIQIWEGRASAVKTLNNRSVLNTIEEISANTENRNVAGALAAKTMMADYNAKINQINSNINKYYISEVKSPENTGFQTLLEYVMSLHNNGVRHAIFSSTNFSDLPAQNWGFSIESVSVSGAINVRVYKHLSADEYYFRAIGVEGNWISDWQKFVYQSNIMTINATGLTSSTAIPWNSIHIQNSGTNAVVFFSNWTGESCFPENYGSGIILPCMDVTNKRILYIGQSGKMYTGFFYVTDKNNITWYTTTA